jgi:phospholipid-binding lipoprotein MlaA
MELVDTRADLIRVERAFGDAALDPYAFQREAYLQRRRSQVYDGNPPAIKFDFDDTPEKPALEESTPPAQ